MGTKNNPKNRGKNNKKKIMNGKVLEPILCVLGKKKVICAKYAKTSNIVCDDKQNPIPWDNIISEAQA